MKRVTIPLFLAWLALSTVGGAQFPDRFVWVFGWNLRQDRDIDEIGRVIDTAGQHGLNGAVVSFGLDTLCKKPEAYFRRLKAVRQACDRNELDLIPAVFSVGYGGAALSHDRNLAEGLWVEDAHFAVQGSTARFVPDPAVRLTNGGFEEFTGNNLKRYRFHDQPGTVSFLDTDVKHGGAASLRLENFTANPHGHGRVMQEVRVQPHRCYRISLWVKTQNLQPPNAFKLQVLAGKRTLAPRAFKIQSTGDWRKLTMAFNSLEFESVRLYAGLWRGKSGKVWIDDWTLEELGPLNVLHRPGTPVTVRNLDGSVTYVEGQDYASLTDPGYSPGNVDRKAPSLKCLPGSRIKDGQRLRVSWYHSMVINNGQVTVCMAEPASYEIYDHEAALLAEQGFPMLVACYYDADSLDQVKAWLDLARTVPGVRGFMYTPWQRKYELLGEFGDLLRRAP